MTCLTFTWHTHTYSITVASVGECIVVTARRSDSRYWTGVIVTLCVCVTSVLMSSLKTAKVHLSLNCRYCCIYYCMYVLSCCLYFNNGCTIQNTQCLIIICKLNNYKEKCIGYKLQTTTELATMCMSVKHTMLLAVQIHTLFVYHTLI